MKNFIFKSSNNSDLYKILLSLEIIKKQNRDLRQDLIDVKSRLTRQLTIMTGNTTVEREEEYPEEELGSNKNIPEGV